MSASLALSSTSARLKTMASKIYSRMEFLGLNETQLSERCSLAAVHMSEDQDVPGLMRDRLSKILMNRHDFPAKAAARVITHAELAVLAKVLKVSIEWLDGQADNQDPVVWNVLAESDRVLTFTHLLQEYEKPGTETRVWSQSPLHSYSSEAFVYAFNRVYYGSKPGIGDTRPLVEFYNRVARIRRKELWRSDRSSGYTGLISRSRFEAVICGTGAFAAISKTILKSNLDVMIDVITNPSLSLKLVIVKDECAESLKALRNYEFLGAVDDLITVWRYHSGDIGWSEHPSYTKPHRQLLDRLALGSLFQDVNETVEYLRSLQNRLRRGPKYALSSQL